MLIRSYGMFGSLRCAEMQPIHAVNMCPGTRFLHRGLPRAVVNLRPTTQIHRQHVASMLRKHATMARGVIFDV